MSDNENDQGVKERIKARLLEATDDESLKAIRGQLKADGEKQGSIDACVSELRKKGHLKFGATGAGDFYPVKIGKSEIIPPEQALARIRLQDGDYKLGFTDGMSVLIMASRYNQLLATSQAEVLSNQLKIMEESRKGSIEAAQEAASDATRQTLGAIMPQILDTVRQSAVATSPSPMMSMFAQTMQPYLGQMIGNLMTAFQPKTGQPGIQPAQPGQPVTQPLTPQTGFQQPVGQQASEDEVKEAFQ